MTLAELLLHLADQGARVTFERMPFHPRTLKVSVRIEDDQATISAVLTDVHVRTAGVDVVALELARLARELGIYLPQEARR